MGVGIGEHPRREGAFEPLVTVHLLPLRPLPVHVAEEGRQAGPHRAPLLVAEFGRRAGQQAEHRVARAVYEHAGAHGVRSLAPHEDRLHDAVAVGPHVRHGGAEAQRHAALADQVVVHALQRLGVILQPVPLVGAVVGRHAAAGAQPLDHLLADAADQKIHAVGHGAEGGHETGRSQPAEATGPLGQEDAASEARGRHGRGDPRRAAARDQNVRFVFHLQGTPPRHCFAHERSLSNGVFRCPARRVRGPGAASHGPAVFPPVGVSASRRCFLRKAAMSRYGAATRSTPRYSLRWRTTQGIFSPSMYAFRYDPKRGW